MLISNRTTKHLRGRSFMGISYMTAIEIFTHPTDLEIITGMDGGKYGFAITRGPGHDHKVMIDTCGFAETQDLVIEKVKEMLDSICKAMQIELADPRSFISRYYNPDNRELDQEEFLTQDLINWIVFELRQNGSASTYNMLTRAQ